MSDSTSTHTKNATETADFESTDAPLINDRWSNNITYRQLVISSCIGILQLWWHPYLHDLSKLLPFLFLYNVFSVFIGYPMFYLELVIGVVTKKGVLDSWDLAPLARGVGIAMLITCAFSALALSVVCAWLLAQIVHSAHAFLPWLHCAAAASPPCAARHRPLSVDSETPAHSFFFNFVLDLKRDGVVGGLGDVVWELTIYYIISWVLIYFIAFKKIYSYSKLVLFKDLLAYFVLVTCAVGSSQLEGAGRMFQDCDWSVLLQGTKAIGSSQLEGAGRMFMDCDWSMLLQGTKMWREAIEYSLLEMAVSQGTLVMLGSYCPQNQVKLSSTALLSFVASKTSCMGSALILGATHGALLRDYKTNSTNFRPGPATPVILWADFVARVPGSQFWSAVIFFTLFVVSICFVALMVQTIMSTFTGRSIRKITWAFLIVICILFCMIGSITLCTQGGLYIQKFLMDWPVTRPRSAVAAVMAFIVTYTYGQTTFCEDVYFSVGEYPCLFIRICWALAPFLLATAFLSGAAERAAATDWAVAGWALTLLTLLPVTGIFITYLAFKCRVRNIVRNEK